MSRYRLARVAELAHQLRLSPGRLRLQQLLGAERLLSLIQPGQFYPYSWVCWHLTGYRAPIGRTDPAELPGLALQHDLLILAEEISKHNPIPRTGLAWEAWPLAELAERLEVSPKTISRWRKKGLTTWWVREADGVVRLAVPDPALRRFVAANGRLVQRSRRFTHLSEKQRGRILERARELRIAGYTSIHHICRLIAAETGRSVETIRYTLRRREAYWMEQVPAAVEPRPDEHEIIFQCWQNGDDPAALAERFGKRPKTIRQILLHQRRRRILARPVEYIYSPEFDLPDAEARIMAGTDGEGAAAHPRRRLNGESEPDPPLYLLDLGSAALLTPEQERDLFRRYNYVKFRLAATARRLRKRCTRPLVEEAEGWLRQAESLRAHLVEANLRLVVCLAKRHLQTGIGLPELVSEGNLVLMRAVEKFDYSRGFRFSTYASWAILKHFARVVGVWQNRQNRQQTGCDEMLKLAPSAHEPVGTALDRRLVAGMVQKLLGKLPSRERKILQWHYGLAGEQEPRSLSQIAGRLGISKERVRQIERRALEKLRGMLAERQLQSS